MLSMDSSSRRPRHSSIYAREDAQRCKHSRGLCALDEHQKSPETGLNEGRAWFRRGVLQRIHKKRKPNASIMAPVMRFAEPSKTKRVLRQLLQYVRGQGSLRYDESTMFQKQHSTSLLRYVQRKSKPPPRRKPPDASLTAHSSQAARPARNATASYRAGRPPSSFPGSSARQWSSQSSRSNSSRTPPTRTTRPCRSTRDVRAG